MVTVVSAMHVFKLKEYHRHNCMSGTSTFKGRHLSKDVDVVQGMTKR